MNFAEDFKGISFDYNDKSYEILEILRSTARTGKSVRIQKYKLHLPVQSIFDHKRSLAYNLDLFLDAMHLDLNRKILAEFCIFHDMSEVVIGDIPAYTNEELAGMKILSADERKKLEESVNMQILNSLPLKLKEPFHDFLQNFKPVQLTQKDIDLYHNFELIDELEPIVTVWRYIYFNRTNINIFEFLAAMYDFFTNPRPASLCYSEDLRNLIEFLQSSENAQHYFEIGSEVFMKMKSSVFNCEFCKKLIENNPIEYIL